MIMRSYMKKKTKIDTADLSVEELLATSTKPNRKFLCRFVALGAFLVVALSMCCHVVNSIKNTTSELNSEGMLALASAPLNVASTKKDLISIPKGTVKANPFLPYRDIGGNSVSDVPSYELIAPPEQINENADAARVMDTIVSGILYDKYSPSAILNIEGNDYLVKKGDVVNNYKVLSIMQDSVTVKLGNNTYKAGIGEILTEGEVNMNTVSNLNKKFGGER